MDKIGIYIHIPFCESKCPYCDFYSINNADEHRNYVDNLKYIIEKRSKLHKRPVETVYFGGGTPSVLGSDLIIEVLEKVKCCFDVDLNAEITLEVNPCSADKIDFVALRTSGFNRLSIGLQSADDNELKVLGRRHSAIKVKEVVDKAKDSGFINISLDLMLCVPKQTKNSLTESIRFCKDCDVQHISAYILKIEENTPFYKIKDKLNLFDDDLQAQMYLHAVNEFEKYGFNQYEISNFSKEGLEGKHNLKYWRDEEYLGFGPSAHSYIDGKRYFYNRDINAFYNDELIYDCDGGDFEEYIMLKLRLKEGLDLKDFETKYDIKPNEKLYTLINNLQENDLVHFEGDTVSLTPQGFLMSNTIINYIIDYF